MPSLDMKLEELRTYTGSSPEPEDMGAFWEHAIIEMRENRIEYTLTPSEFQTDYAECFDLFFHAGDGVRLYAKYLKPKNLRESSPAILRFHGYHGYSENWVEYLPYVANGCCVAALDCRGQGGRSHDRIDVSGQTLEGFITRGLLDGPESLYYYSTFLDTVRLADLISSFDEVDEQRLGTYGFSQGGALAAACAALVPSIKAVASVFPFLSDYKRVWEIDLTNRAYHDLRNFFRRFDPLHEQEDRWFETLGYIDVKNLAPMIRGKVLMGLTLMDETCPPSTQFAIYNRIRSEKDALIYQDYGHENLIGMGDSIYQFMAENL